jgi:hypothetical protein
LSRFVRHELGEAEEALLQLTLRRPIALEEPWVTGDDVDAEARVDLEHLPFERASSSLASRRASSARMSATKTPTTTTASNALAANILPWSDKRLIPL